MYYNASIVQEELLRNMKGALSDLSNKRNQLVDISGLNLSSFWSVLVFHDFQGAKLSNANLRGANLQRAYLRHVDLRETVSNSIFHYLVILSHDSQVDIKSSIHVVSII